MRSQGKLVSIGLVIAASMVPRANGVGAQQANAENKPPPLVLIGVENVREGRGAAHAKIERQWVQAFKKAGVTLPWLGATTVTGPNQFWFMSPVASFGDLESKMKAIDGAAELAMPGELLEPAHGEDLSSSRSFVVHYRADLSRPGGTPVSKSRYFQVLMFHVRPGQSKAFEDLCKMVAQVVTETKADRHWMTYQGASGESDDTFMIFISLQSLSELDPDESEAAFAKAMTPARQNQWNQLEASGIASQTSMILRFAPRMSNPTADWIAADPKFWNPTP